jgi:polyisoprenoid-binding protein YceI
MMVSESRGTSRTFSGEIQFDEKDIKASSVSVTIKASKHQQPRTRSENGHLNSRTSFDTAKFPDITFKSGKILSKGDGYLAVGPLHDARRDEARVEIPFKVKVRCTLGPTKRIGVTVR